ncbi:hypothetical protein [Dyella mobilis]|uniref:Uncharacterized protein n=1 Tax=Dyella mobilis TaxID=1849582 RepID=A0ABS2KK99_9GAMM|nr:hypothetical protein [Dyella mobilis]MBM7131589.1 hypothetical protein [Dyella mobilis]GLQ96437.1 hypothetical protein GCM10007863_08550 [Dyella mobilis]
MQSVSKVHPIMSTALAGVAPPQDAAVSRIRQLEAQLLDLERRLSFQKEATAQLAAQLEELCPHSTTAEMPDGSEVPAPAEVVRSALVWLREKHDLEFYDRIDEQTLLHFEVEKAELRIAAREGAL